MDQRSQRVVHALILPRKRGVQPGVQMRSRGAPHGRLSAHDDDRWSRRPQVAWL